MSSLLLAATIAARTAGPAAGAAAGACHITQTKSRSGSRATIEFENKTGGTVKVYWLSYSGAAVYYRTLTPGASYSQGTYAGSAWEVRTSSGACTGYVIAPRPVYVISGAARGGGPAPVAAATAVEPKWVYLMIDNFNLGISLPSAAIGLSSQLYDECRRPDYAFVDGNAPNLVSRVAQFAAYSNLVPGWIARVAALPASAATRLAHADLVVAQPLHQKEVTAWSSAVAAIKAHNCGNFAAALKLARQSGAPDWADQYKAVNAIARLYGSDAASDQAPYAQTLP
jgi:hypothetical protein